MDEHGPSTKEEELQRVRLALKRLRLGELSELEQAEWNFWEAFNQVEDDDTCH